MKNPISLSLASPCSKDWSNFAPTANGGFCNSCNKNVIDFTKMTDHDIRNFFQDKPIQTCGRFRPPQLKEYSEQEAQSPRLSRIKWMEAGFLSFFLILASKESFSKNAHLKESVEVVYLQDHDREKEVSANPGHIIKGIVKDEYNEPLPGVNIYLKGENVGTVTDANGQFKFPKELMPGDILVFNYLGFVTREYVVPKNAPEIIEVPLLMLYMDLMGEVAVDEIYSAKTSIGFRWWHRLKQLF